MLLEFRVLIRTRAARRGLSKGFDRTTGVFVVGLIVYLLTHLGLRLLEGSSLRWDESEQMLFSQQLALGYNDQPPVYTWILWITFRLTGVSLVGVYLLKILIVASIYLGLFVLVRQIASSSAAICAASSLLLAPYFVWSALIDGAHTLFVTAFVPLVFLVANRIHQRAKTQDFVGLGLICGFGFLAKYSFALVVIALVAAALSIPDYRRRLRDPRLMLSMAIAALIVLPHSLWLLNHWELVRERPMHRGGVDVAASFVSRLVHGFGSLGETTLLTIGPLVAAIVLLFPRETWRIVREPARSDAARLLGRSLGFLTLILVILIALGVSRFRTHWLIPAAVLLPAYVFSRFAETPRDRPHYRVCALAAVAVVVVAAVRIGGIAMDSRTGGKNWAQDQLHDALAAKVAQKGLDRATFVGDHTLACGNLRLRFPNTRVACNYYPAFVPADLAGATCLIWEATYQPGLTPRFEQWLMSNGLFDRLDWNNVTYIDMPIRLPGLGLRRIGLMKLRS